MASIAASEMGIETRSALDRLLSATAEDMAEVNALILTRADSHVEMVPQLALHLIEAGGKRLRPMLTVAAAHLFGSPHAHRITFAASVEFMHNATLLHDDVVDESTMRRGKPAARMIWGNEASVLVGDFLLGQAFLMMVEAGRLDALNVMATAAAQIAEGEVYQLSKSRDLDTTAEEYREIIHAKTAVLFGTATEIGAMAGGADEPQRTALRTYGIELGRAFQLVDDMLDFGGAAGALGKNTGDDLREGKMTLPVILALRKANAAERGTIVATLGDADAGEDRFAAVRQILERYDVLETVLTEARGYAEAARTALDILPASTMRDLLAEIADFCVERAH
jgi:octaprenyl-diphosphate synthase